MVVFCRFRSDIDAAHEACTQSLPKHKDAQGNALPVSLELSGTRDELERWQAGEAQALVVQVQSGSVGISLVRANVAIYYSLSSNWSSTTRAAVGSTGPARSGRAPTSTSPAGERSTRRS